MVTRAVLQCLRRGECKLVTLQPKPGPHQTEPQTQQPSRRFYKRRKGTMLSSKGRACLKAWSYKASATALCGNNTQRFSIAQLEAEYHTAIAAQISSSINAMRQSIFPYRPLSVTSWARTGPGLEVTSEARAETSALPSVDTKSRRRQERSEPRGHLCQGGMAPALTHYTHYIKPQHACQCHHTCEILTLLKEHTSKLYRSLWKLPEAKLVFKRLSLKAR